MQKIKVKYLKWLPIKNVNYITIYPCIYVKKGYEITQSEIIHETIHANRQQEFGIYNWIWKYFTDDKFKYEEEIQAHKIQLNFENLYLIKENRVKELAIIISEMCNYYQPIAKIEKDLL